MALGLAVAGQRITTALLNRIYGIADAVSHSVAASSLSDLSSIYQIPADDAVAGTCYRLTAFGDGTWGSTQQALTWAMNLAGTSLSGTGSQPVIASTAFSASAAFRWQAEIILVCVGDGASATWVATIRGTVTETANAILPGTAADNTVPFVGSATAAVTQDSTVANNLSIRAKWNSATGSPTLTCRGTLFERVN